LVLCHFSAHDSRKGWCRTASRSVNSSAILLRSTRFRMPPLVTSKNCACAVTPGAT
jgi:hypothetical protein